MGPSASGNDLQIVVKAIDEATGTLNQVKEQVSGLSAGVQSEFGNMTTATEQASGALRGFFELSVGREGLQSMAEHLNTVVEAANKYQQAFLNLNSVSSSFGISAQSAREAAEQLSSDGLMTVTQSATALANLLATGFSLPQATQLLHSLKDATAATKDSTVSLGDALDQTTQGLRQGTVATGAAAGGTRVMGEMLARAGLSAKDLAFVATDASVRMAIFNGFMQNSAKYAGDAAQMSQMFAGAQTNLSTQTEEVNVKLGNLVTAVGTPLLQWLGETIAQHQNLIVAMAAAGGAAVAFGATIITLVGVGMLALSVLGGPATLILIGLSVLFGTVVFGAVQKLEGQFGSLINNFSRGSGQMGSAAQSGMGAAAEQARKLAEQLQAVDENIAKANRDYVQSLTNIVSQTQSKISDLQSQITGLNSDFATAQQQRTDDFTSAQADMAQSHQDTVDQIGQQLQDEKDKGRFANLTMLRDLQQRLDKENASYVDSVAKKKAQYDKDTANAEAQHQTQLAKLQGQLQQEADLMNRHTSDLQGIRAADALDEIDKLKQTHADEMKGYDEQKQKIRENASASAIGYATELNKAPGMINTADFRNIGGLMGKSMADELKNAFMDSLRQLPQEVWNWFTTFYKWWVTQSVPGGSVLVNALHSMHVPGFASGVQNFGGGMALVGEQGPELAYLPPGTDVLPAPKTRQVLASGTGTGTGVTINQTNHNYSQFDLDAANARLGYQLATRTA